MVVLGAFRIRYFAIAVGVALMVLAAVFARDLWRKRPPQASEPPEPPAVDDSTIDDPIAPGRRMRAVGQRAPGGGIRGVGNDVEWVSAKPDERWQASKSADARGVDPCDAPDPGFAGFSRWKALSGGTLYLVPEQGALDKDGRFDLFIHFHGHDMARKGFIAAKKPIVFVGLSDNDYGRRLAGPDALEHIVLAIETAMSEESGRKASAHRIALTAWSGGYSAIGAIIPHDAERVDGVVLLDGLHGALTRSKLELQMEPFVDYAKRATRGDAFMFVTHSSIEPGTFASTTQTAHLLIDAVGGRPLAVERSDDLGLELISAFSYGDFHVRGYAGGGKPDHCAHLALMEDATRAIAARWRR